MPGCALQLQNRFFLQPLLMGFCAQKGPVACPLRARGCRPQAAGVVPDCLLFRGCRIMRGGASGMPRPPTVKPVFSATHINGLLRTKRTGCLPPALRLPYLSVVPCYSGIPYLIPYLPYFRSLSLTLYCHIIRNGGRGWNPDPTGYDKRIQLYIGAISAHHVAMIPGTQSINTTMPVTILAERCTFGHFLASEESAIKNNGMYRR